MIRRTILILAFIPALYFAPGPLPECAGATPAIINGLYLLNPSSDYDSLGKVVRSYGNSGANTLIIRPVSEAGEVDKKILSKAVFFAHQSGMQLYVILPTRAMTFLLKEHPEWEDLFFDLKSGRIQPSGKLDLFNPRVIVYLSDFFMDIAGYCVDGIILDEDFYYGDTEGLSRRVLDLYKMRFNATFSVRRAFGNLKADSRENSALNEYGEQFWRLAQLKKDNLILLLKNIMSSSRAVNRTVKFGVSMHVPRLFLKHEEVLAWYGLDVRALRKIDLNFFWLKIPHRGNGNDLDTAYSKNIEELSRKATSSLKLVNKPASVIIALQAVSSSGRTLPFWEIEDVSRHVNKSAELGLALMVESDSELPPVLTKKIFKRENLSQ